ncbi:hypothetical protein SLEP1_g18610 [Rubroshorea leprosula]|uniref:Uncharacterized protein n=1 Tax=Rubroshorea leprosula TaxID=152421 RepID=A0AAV5J707_9ROSI|nr:hypothetical protein SLEP1_g18610 [Rubroshorea leprosula]
MDESLETRRSVLANPLASLDSTAQTGHGGDWQEEVFLKIKSMKDMYLGELNHMHQKITARLEQVRLPLCAIPKRFLGPPDL